MSHDTNFDDLAEKFKHKIGDHTKGKLRRAIFWHTLLTDLPYLHSHPLKILDAGGGMGQIALEFAQHQHEIVICDISTKMLALAKTAFDQEAPDTHVTFINAPIQDLQHHINTKFDLILCHAVLEWLEDPETVIQQLVELMPPDGLLSLMFYNKHAIVYRNLIRGNLRKVKSANYAGDKNSLTPQNPLYPDTVFTWLKRNQFDILSTTGLRVFYDNLSVQSRAKINFEDILAMELAHCQQPPYLYLGRYIHVLCRRNSTKG